MAKAKSNKAPVTNSRLAALQAVAQEAVDTYEVDLSEESTGGGGKLLPEGWAFARLVEYVEYGKQPREYKGESKEPALTFRMGFAIWGTPPGQDVSYHNEDGSPGIIRTYDMYHGNNVKSGTKIAFDKLNYTGKHKQFFTMLGEPFLLRIVHKESKDAQGKARTVHRLDLKQTMAPFEPTTGQPYNIPQVEDESLYKLFLWNNPTAEGWESIFIEGTNDQGKSKNWMQERCYEAVDFEDSALAQLLNGADIPDVTGSYEAPEGDEEEEQEDDTPPPPPVKATKAPAKAPATTPKGKAGKAPAAAPVQSSKGKSASGAKASVGKPSPSMFDVPPPPPVG